MSMFHAIQFFDNTVILPASLSSRVMHFKKYRQESFKLALAEAVLQRCCESDTAVLVKAADEMSSVPTCDPRRGKSSFAARRIRRESWAASATE